jgi:hypothetical protein
VSALGLLLVAACGGGPSALLPPSPPPAPALGLAVAHGSVRGFLARPTGAESGPHPTELWLVPQLDDTTRAAAEAAAQGGVLVFVAAPEVDPAAATAYLRGVQGAGPLTVRDQRAPGPPR